MQFINNHFWVPSFFPLEKNILGLKIWLPLSYGWKKISLPYSIAMFEWWIFSSSLLSWWCSRFYTAFNVFRPMKERHVERGEDADLCGHKMGQIKMRRRVHLCICMLGYWRLSHPNSLDLVLVTVYFISSMQWVLLSRRNPCMMFQLKCLIELLLKLTELRRNISSLKR